LFSCRIKNQIALPKITGITTEYHAMGGQGASDLVLNISFGHDGSCSFSYLPQAGQLNLMSVA
jgi:phage tail tube protein FII